jgi:hypothetical protein
MLELEDGIARQSSSTMGIKGFGVQIWGMELVACGSHRIIPHHVWLFLGVNEVFVADIVPISR